MNSDDETRPVEQDPTGRYLRVSAWYWKCIMPASHRAGQHQSPCQHDPLPSCCAAQYPMLLGRGACKRVYKAFDCEIGKEVAWNQVRVN